MNSLRIFLEHLGGNKHLNNFIIDSYKGATVSIFTKNGVTNEIAIRKGVKQGCPLSPLLFNIFIDPIFKFIRDANPDSGFKGEFLDERRIQGYADDIILIANSHENLQIQINSAVQFFQFANVKLNPKKCETFKIDGKNEENKIIIAGEEKEYIANDICLRYLGVSLGS
jgi:hypothetical protein